MFIDENGQFGLAHLYPAQKALILPLTRRGFFSEFTTIVNAYVYALMAERHLFVNPDNMSVTWSDLFDLRPQHESLVTKDMYPLRERLSVKPGIREPYDRMREALLSARDRPRVKIPAIGFKGSLERLTSVISKAAFEPTHAIRKEAKQRLTELGLRESPYYAIHMRGGDKLVGEPVPGGKNLVEGEVVPLSRYMTPILADSPEPTVFVLTDDYREVTALRAGYPQATFLTLCPPGNNGYFQSVYSSQDQAKRTADVRALIVEVIIAERAKLFLGPYLSNVSQFIHQLRYDRPSFSVDSQTRWSPFRTVPLRDNDAQGEKGAPPPDRSSPFDTAEADLT